MTQKKITSQVLLLIQTIISNYNQSITSQWCSNWYLIQTILKYLSNNTQVYILSIPLLIKKYDYVYIVIPKLSHRNLPYLLYKSSHTCHTSSSFLVSNYLNLWIRHIINNNCPPIQLLPTQNMSCITKSLYCPGLNPTILPFNPIQFYTQPI